ncbi:hypothetical protein ABEB36_009771 [Hypothenemus hampei]|uniref:Uncharacterized protein n=1 Tax=Hypothenemus hampei TaxID=57062 RepID=A0ABD1EI23_HYPHA
MIMKVDILLLIFYFAVYTQALECGVSKLNTEQFKKVLTECVKDNETLSKIRDFTGLMSEEEDAPLTTPAKEDESDQDQENEEQVPITRGRNISNIASKNVKLSKNRSKRASTRISSPRITINNKRLPGSTTPQTTTQENGTGANEDQEEKINNVDSNCVLQCIFDKLELADSNGLPDHKKFTAALKTSTAGKQVNDFLQESMDQCFQEVDQSDNGCEYSTNLINCLGEKGKSNCEDWPAGNLPF